MGAQKNCLNETLLLSTQKHMFKLKGKKNNCDATLKNFAYLDVGSFHSLIAPDKDLEK